MPQFILIVMVPLFFADPRPLQRVKEVLDSYNITFEWEIPQGHRDYYIIVYNPVEEPQSQKSLQVRLHHIFCTICDWNRLYFV